MALQLGSLGDALAEAGASPEAARKASEEVAGYENRLGRIEAELGILKWMVTFNLALTVLVLGKLFGVLG